jgi:hypothetical protein
MAQGMLDLNKVIELSPHDKIALTDRECLSAIRLGSLAKIGDISIFQKAIVKLTKLISCDKNTKLCQFPTNTKAYQAHNQIIPRLKEHRCRSEKNEASTPSQVYSNSSSAQKGGKKKKKSVIHYQKGHNNNSFDGTYFKKTNTSTKGSSKDVPTPPTPSQSTTHGTHGKHGSHGNHQRSHSANRYINSML